MLELVVSTEAYRACSKGEGLIQTSSLANQKGRIDSIGAVVAPLGDRASAVTHFQMGKFELGSFNISQLAFPLSYNSGGLLCQEFRGKYHDLDLLFNVCPPSNRCSEDSFHAWGKYCVEFGACFQGKTYREFQRNFDEYRSIAYSIFRMIYGNERAPKVHLRLEPISTNKPLFRELTSLVTGMSGWREQGGQDQQQTYAPTSPSEYESRNHYVTWKDIGGLHRQKEELLLVIDRFLHPEKLAFFGRAPSEQGGYLLVGPTGCGKSMLAKAVATQLKQELGDKIKVYFPSYAQITSIFRGGEAKGVHDLFKTVRKDVDNGLRVIVFLDEFQSVSQRLHSASFRDEALDQLLLELDKFDYTRALFLAGSAQPLGTFDPQMIRPGRFGSIIEVTVPDSEEAREILKVTVNTRRKRARQGNNPHLFEEGGLDYDGIVAETGGFPSAHLVGLIEDAIKRKEKAHMHTHRFTPITTHYVLDGASARRELITRSAKRYGHLIAAQPL